MDQNIKFIPTSFLFILLTFFMFNNEVYSQDKDLSEKDKIDIVFKDSSKIINALLLYQDSVELFVYHQKKQKHILKSEIGFVEKSSNKIAIHAIGGGAHLAGLGVTLFSEKGSIDFSFLPSGIAAGYKYYFQNMKKETKWKRYVGASLSSFNIDFLGKSTYVNQYLNIGTSSFSESLFLSFDVGLLVLNEFGKTGGSFFGEYIPPKSSTNFLPMASITLGLLVNGKRNKIRF